MPKDEQRRQKALQRKAAKRKQKRQTLVRQAVPSTLRAQLRAAGTWPLEECLVSRDWNVPGQLVQILVARSSPQGEIAAGVFLVDLACLGVKNAFAQMFLFRRDYEELRRTLTGSQPMVKADLDLVAKIIREGVAYAERLGFSPDRDYYDTAVLLTGAEPDACNAQIPLGMDGKPFFVSGPHDNVPKIMAQLERAVGPGNFNYLVGQGTPPDLLEGADTDE